VIRVVDLEEVFKTINELKMLHHRVAREYTYNPLVLEALTYKKYGFVPKDDYAEIEIDESSYSKLLLAGLIAERYTLARDRGRLKQLTVSIIGEEGGAGKTTYAVLSAYGALRLLGFSSEEAWRIVERNTFFYPLDLVEYAKQLIEARLWTPFIILDDVGAHISKYWVYLGETHWLHFFRVLDQMKDWCGVLIMTARSQGSMPKRLREISKVVVDASEVLLPTHTVLSVFKFYPADEYGKLSRKRRPHFIDILPPTAKMPDSLWNKMMEERRKSQITSLAKLKAELEERREKAERKTRRRKRRTVEEVEELEPQPEVAG